MSMGKTVRSFGVLRVLSMDSALWNETIAQFVVGETGAHYVDGTVPKEIAVIVTIFSGSLNVTRLMRFNRPIHDGPSKASIEKSTSNDRPTMAVNVSFSSLSFRNMNLWLELWRSYTNGEITRIWRRGISFCATRSSRRFISILVYFYVCMYIKQSDPAIHGFRDKSNVYPS